MGISGYQDLDVWKKAMAVSREVRKITNRLPQFEQFELASQMRRASSSISSNISEGYGRGTRKEYVSFLNNARGSNNEVQTQLLICVDCGYVTKADVKVALALSYDVGRMLNKLIERMKEQPQEK